MRKKEDIDRQLLYVASPKPVISFKHSSRASRKIEKISGSNEEMHTGDNRQ